MDCCNIIVVGCFGRLGSVICNMAGQGTQVVAGVDIITPGDALPYPIYTDINACEQPADVVVVCVPPHAAASVLAATEYCETRQIPMVLCTTGLDAATMEAVKKTTQRNAVMISANMALGINLLANLLNKAAKLLYDANFDIEIIERHHNQKLDAPSGTAYLLADAANDALGGNMRYTLDRSSNQHKRERDEIGLHALRGGTITGEHSVVFAGLDEVVELKHIAQSRDVFAVGALKAVLYMKGQPAGLYTMQDMINKI